MTLPLTEKVIYANEDEATELLINFINSEKDSNPGKVKATLQLLLKNPENKVRRAVLKAIKATNFIDKDILTQIIQLTRDDPEKTVRDTAVETILGILKETNKDNLPEYVQTVVRQLSKGKAMIDITDVVKSIGIDNAKDILTKNVDAETKDYIKFAIDYIENEEQS